jgi:U2-associated protein SR140
VGYLVIAEGGFLAFANVGISSCSIMRCALLILFFYCCRQKLRHIEIALIEYRESLEEQGMKNSEEIERKVAIHRKRLEADGLSGNQRVLPEKREKREDSRDSSRKRNRSESQNRSQSPPQKSLTRERVRDHDLDKDRHRDRDRQQHDLDKDRKRRAKSSSRERDDHDRSRERDRDWRRRGMR